MSANRLAVLARYGLTAKAPLLRELADPRRTAALVAADRHLESAAVDDALDLFDLLMPARLLRGRSICLKRPSNPGHRA